MQAQLPTCWVRRPDTGGRRPWVGVMQGLACSRAGLGSLKLALSSRREPQVQASGALGRWAPVPALVQPLGPLAAVTGHVAVAGGSKSQSRAECEYVRERPHMCMCMLYAHTCLFTCVHSVLCGVFVHVWMSVRLCACVCIGGPGRLRGGPPHLLPRQSSDRTVSSPVTPYLHLSSGQAPGQGQEAEASSAR